VKARLVYSYLVLVFLALVLFTVPVALSSARLLHSTLERTVVRESRLFAPLVLRQDAAAASAIADGTRDFEQATGSRVRLARAGQTRPQDPQVAAAFGGQSPPAEWRYSALLGAEGVSVVLPVRSGGRVVAVVQLVAPTRDVDAQIRGIWTFRLLTGLGVLVLAAGVAVVLAGTLVRPLRRLDTMARSLGEGDYSVRVVESGPPEIVTLAHTLNLSAQRTEALLSAQRIFVADASHQLRTPLTAMQLCLDNVRDTSEDPAVQGRLALVDGEVVRMRHMVEGLLALTRAEATTAKPQPVDLAQVIETRVKVLAEAFAEAEVTLVVVASARCQVLVVPGSMEQILDNILSNALAVSPAGTTVTVLTRRTLHGVELVICDQGPGMSAEQRGRAFDRFWRAGAPGAGTGLGLSIVRQLVEHHEGKVELHPGADSGLEVRITLPRA